MVSADQGMDTGYINITHAVSGQEWNLSYALGPVEFVEIKWATAVWDLPEGVYDVEVHNYNTVEGERYDVDYTVLSAGLFCDLSDRNAFVDDSSDLMAMYYAICISMVIVLAGVILIARKPKEQEFSDYNDKKAVAKKMRKGWE